jgi:pimeloyl-ACP methyl ester carboxylesterase
MSDLGHAAAMRRVRTGEVDLHFEAVGNGEPLVLIHGLGSCGEDWAPQVAHFRDRFQVVVLDLRGHGHSSKPRGPYSIPVFAQDTADLLRALQLGPAHVVGISLGGMVAFQLAVDAPELVKSLTVVNSGPAVPAATFKQRLPLNIRLAYLRFLGLPRMAKMIAKRLFPEPDQASLRAAFVTRLAANDKHCYRESLKAIFGWSVVDRLGAIRCPVLVLTADQDYAPVELKRAYAQRLADARVVVIPDSRHALPMEKPRQFNAALDEFLTSLAAGRPAVGPALTAVQEKTS